MYRFTCILIAVLVCTKIYSRCSGTLLILNRNVIQLTQAVIAWLLHKYVNFITHLLLKSSQHCLKII